MTRGTGTWLAICFVTLLTGLLSGVIAGWSFRERTADHRYITALAQRHEAEGSYYITKLDQEIRNNKTDKRKP